MSDTTQSLSLSYYSADPTTFHKQIEPLAIETLIAILVHADAVLHKLDPRWQVEAVKMRLEFIDPSVFQLLSENANAELDNRIHTLLRKHFGRNED